MRRTSQRSTPDILWRTESRSALVFVVPPLGLVVSICRTSKVDLPSSGFRLANSQALPRLKKEHFRDSLGLSRLNGCKMHVQGDTVMGARDLGRYKRLLLAKLDEFSATRAEVESSRIAAGTPEGDLMEQANADAEAELQIRVHKADSHLLRAIEDALARIRQETFGVCEACKQPISRARLEAVPWARHCRDCKEREHT